MFNSISPLTFFAALKQAKSLGGNFDSVHLYSNVEYAKMTCFLSPDLKSGYALKGDELVSVFSTVKGRGDALVRHAISHGASQLDAFDGYLIKLYARHGFYEWTRMSNWTPGQPDVVYMALKQGLRK